MLTRVREHQRLYTESCRRAIAWLPIWRAKRLRQQMMGNNGEHKGAEMRRVSIGDAVTFCYVLENFLPAWPPAAAARKILMPRYMGLNTYNATGTILNAIRPQVCLDATLVLVPEPQPVSNALTECHQIFQAFTSSPTAHDHV